MILHRFPEDPPPPKPKGLLSRILNYLGLIK
jgi:hypothetical protein